MERRKLYTGQNLSQEERLNTSLNLLKKNFNIPNHQFLDGKYVYSSLDNGKPIKVTDTAPEGLLQKTGLAQALMSRLTSRDFLQYLDSFQISLEDLGSHILDLGAGKDEAFSKGAAVQEKKVVSVNPRLLQEENRNFVKQDGNWQERSIAGLAQNLPFKNAVFDSVVSLFAFPYWVHPTEWKKSLKEILRVLKPGGRIYLKPMRSARFDLVEFTDILSGLGVDYDLTDQHCTVTKPALVLTKAVV